MRRIVIALAFAAALVSTAVAQNTVLTQGPTVSAPPGTTINMVPGSSIGAPPDSQTLQPASGPAIGSGAIGAPTYVVPPANVEEHGGGIINIGQALGPFLQPYVDAAVNALILAFVGWLGMILKNKFNVSIDQGHRDALVTALQNQAGSLIADGFVKIQNGRVTVPSTALAESANEIMAVIPDAAARLGFTPDYVAKRIIDFIPQIPAGAAMIAGATSVPPPAAKPA